MLQEGPSRGSSYDTPPLERQPVRHEQQVSPSLSLAFNSDDEAHGACSCLKSLAVCCASVGVCRVDQDNVASERKIVLETDEEGMRMRDHDNLRVLCECVCATSCVLYHVLYQLCIWTR